MPQQNYVFHRAIQIAAALQAGEFRVVPAGALWKGPRPHEDGSG